MRNMRNVMIEAHRMTREIKRTSPEVDYRAQLGLCLSFLMMNKKEEKVMEMAKLEGSEKQIKWAEDLRKEFVTNIEEYKEFLNNEEEEVILRHARYFSMTVNKEFKEFLLNLNIDEEKLKKFKKKDSLYIMNNIDDFIKKVLLNEKDSQFWIKTRNFGRDKSDNAFLIAVYEYLK